MGGSRSCATWCINTFLSKKVRPIKVLACKRFTFPLILVHSVVFVTKVIWQCDVRRQRDLQSPMGALMRSYQSWKSINDKIQYCNLNLRGKILSIKCLKILVGVLFSYLIVSLFSFSFFRICVQRILQSGFRKDECIKIKQPSYAKSTRFCSF